jgi:hypothetical protein
MRAYWAIWPAQLFKVRAGSGFVGENLVSQIAGHSHVLTMA